MEGITQVVCMTPTQDSPKIEIGIPKILGHVMTCHKPHTMEVTGFPAPEAVQIEKQTPFWSPNGSDGWVVKKKCTNLFQTDGIPNMIF
jgi:hypothetical protein